MEILLPCVLHRAYEDQYAGDFAFESPSWGL